MASHSHAEHGRLWPPRIHVLLCCAVLSGCLLLLFSLVVPAGAAPADPSPGVESVSHHGDGVALQTAARTYLWDDAPIELGIALTGSQREVLTVCAAATRTDTDRSSFGCATIEPGSTTEYVTLSRDGWPPDKRGDRIVQVILYQETATGDRTVVDSMSIPIHVFKPQGDLSGNGLLNEQEIEVGTHPALADTDGDGLSDSLEVVLGTDPRNPYTPIHVGIGVFGIIGSLLVVSVLVFGRPIEWLDSNGTDGTDSVSDPADRIPPSERSDRSRPLSAESDGHTEPSERIGSILESAGGRQRQSAIVTETGWSKSKVSRVLSSMEDDEEITRIRLGREKLVCLAGHEPEDVPSRSTADEP
ncbi:MAG: DUF7343 domain-containing protein [Halobacteriota archaeon]